jgi:N-acetylglutamate synthase
VTLPAAKRMRALEERALNAWPALQTVHMDGWILRFSRGYTKRANSACTLGEAAAPLAEIGESIEALYRRNRQEPIFRLTPLAGTRDEAWLTERGYARIEPTAILTGDHAAFGHDDPAVSFSDEPDEAWLDGFARGNRYGPAVRPTLELMLAAIRPPAFCATITHQGRACGYGLGVVERGVVGLFDILVDEPLRGRGFGRRLVAAMLARGADEGARGAYLQVLETNEAAITLYRRLGFAKAYGYVYWRPKAG